MIGVPVQYFLYKDFSFHKLEGFFYGEFRDTYFVLGCLKLFNFLTEQPKVENQTQKIKLKLFYGITIFVEKLLSV